MDLWHTTGDRKDMVGAMKSWLHIRTFQAGIILCALILGAFFRPSPNALAAGLVTTSLPSEPSQADEDNLAQSLVGSGVSISNVNYTGATQAAGTFSGGTGIVGFESGIILSSGYISNVIGPN